MSLSKSALCVAVALAAFQAQAAPTHLGPYAPLAGAADIRVFDVGISAGGDPRFGGMVVLSGPIGVISPLAWEAGAQVGGNGLLAAVEPAIWLRTGNFVRKGQHFGLRLGVRGGYGVDRDDDHAFAALGGSLHGQWAWHWHEMGGLSVTGGYDVPAEFTAEGLVSEGQWTGGLRYDQQIGRNTALWLGMGLPLNLMGAGASFEW